MYLDFTEISGNKKYLKFLSDSIVSNVVKHMRQEGFIVDEHASHSFTRKFIWMMLF